MLRICAEFADRWNSFGTVAEMRERNQILDAHCAARGRDPRTITRSFYGWASKMAEQGLPDPWASVGAFEDVIGRYAEVGNQRVHHGPARSRAVPDPREGGRRHHSERSDTMKRWESERISGDWSRSAPRAP
jgi:hypothetical protein